MKLFCFGFGQVAQSFVDHLLNCNVDLKLTTTSRKNTSELTFKNLKYFNYEFNENDFDKDLIDPLKASDHILISVPPINGKDMFIERLVKNNLNLQNLKWLTYLSSTSVYGNHDGAWVNEDSTTNPQTLAGKNRLNVEKDWLFIGTKNSLPVQIFRLSGIYSDRYNAITRLRNDQKFVVEKKNHFFSRIHVKDIAQTLYLSLNKSLNNDIYNLSDDKPASNIEVVKYACNLINFELPKIISFDELEEGMLKDFYKDSKKVSNKKIKDIFKLKLIYPTYEEGLKVNV